MLQIIVPEVEKWDEERLEFVYNKSYTLNLEHSLVSISKWESKWCVPFLSKEDKTVEQTIDYIKCMTINQNVPNYVYENLTNQNISDVSDYINAPMTATSFSNHSNNKGSREIFTAELIYYSMIALNIPFECQKWHLNRLLTLIRVCDIKNTPPQKMNRRDMLNKNAALNAARKKQLNTKG